MLQRCLGLAPAKYVATGPNCLAQLSPVFARDKSKSSANFVFCHRKNSVLPSEITGQDCMKHSPVHLGVVSF